MNRVGPDGREPTRMIWVHEASPGGAARVGASNNAPAGRHRAERVPGDGCSAQMGERLSPGGGMCDRLVGPDLTRHQAPAHAQPAAQGARLEPCGGQGRHGVGSYQRVGIAPDWVGLCGGAGATTGGWSRPFAATGARQMS